MSTTKRKISKRSQVIGAIFLLLLFMLVCRFYVLQVVDASYFQQATARQYHSEHIIPAQRGSIYDRNGEILAQEAAAYTVVAILSNRAFNRVENPIHTAEQLAPILNMSVEKLIQLLTRENRYQVELRPGGWKIDQETMREIKKLKLPGILFVEENKRYYPNQNFASYILGFLNLDRKPVMGLEAHLNEYLEGKDGYIKYDKDNRGLMLPQGVKDKQAPQNGKNVYLTIDSRIQLYIEQALEKAYEQYEPEQMTVIVSRPQTGEILGMSSRPSFNPNDYSNIKRYMNHAVSGTFEPGSTFKIITLAAAIEEGLFDPEETFMSGSYHKVPGNIIRDHVRQGWGQITFLEGVKRSSNVAFTILGWERMDRDTFYDYLYRFGYGTKTGIDLPGESNGFVKPPHTIFPIDRATMTFGHGIAVTAIQQVAAINAIANGGTLYKPHIISHIVNSETEEIMYQAKPEVVREQVVSYETTRELADVLESTVLDGTGRNFYLEGYQVAGKTGTAQKLGPDGKYIQGEYLHSFIGFAPKDNPEVVLYVLVDAPKVDPTLGGTVVAEIFKEVAKNTLQYLSVQPQIEEVMVYQVDVQGQRLPDLTGLSIMQARQRAMLMGLEVIVLGDDMMVTEQSPAAGSMVYENGRLYLISGHIAQVRVPSFNGWSLREVIDWSNMAQMKIKINGSGYVYNQNLIAGELVEVGHTLEVNLKPSVRIDTTAMEVLSSRQVE